MCCLILKPFGFSTSWLSQTQFSRMKSSFLVKWYLAFKSLYSSPRQKKYFLTHHVPSLKESQHLINACFTVLYVDEDSNIMILHHRQVNYRWHHNTRAMAYLNMHTISPFSNITIDSVKTNSPSLKKALLKFNVRNLNQTPIKFSFTINLSFKRSLINLYYNIRVT